MTVKEITTQEEAAAAIQISGSKLLVIDWYANWCGPCKRAGPIFEQISNKPEHADVVFMKADGDCAALKPIAQSLGVAAFPTFMVFKGQKKVAQDSNVAKLEQLIEEHKQEDLAAKFQKQGYPDGHINLEGEVIKKDCECLNQAATRTLSAVWQTDDDSYVESDCDEQLIIQIPFNQSVKIHSLRIKGAPSSGHNPKNIKLFLSQQNLDFDDAEALDAVQELELSAQDLDGQTFIPLRYMKFQNVFHLTIFVSSNQGDEETTQIRSLELVGTPKKGLQMEGFKRVAGKVGERE